MKRLSHSVVLVEDGDTPSVITAWIHTHKATSEDQLVNIDEWVMMPKPGDILIFELKGQGQYRLSFPLKPMKGKKGKSSDTKGKGR